MPIPTPEIFQSIDGRHNRASVRVVWTQAESQDLDNYVVLNRDAVSGKINDARFAVDSVEWVASDTISAVLEFDSMPPSPEGTIVSITPAASSGEIDFTDYPSGCIPDPIRSAPGNVVLTTLNALPGDELFMSIRFREKGNKHP